MLLCTILTRSPLLALLSMGGMACHPHDGEGTDGKITSTSTTEGSTGDANEWEPGAWIGHWHVASVSHATGIVVYDLELRADGTAIQKKILCGGGEDTTVTTRWTDSLGVLQIIPPEGSAAMPWLELTEVSTVIFEPGDDCNELIAESWDGDIRQAQDPFLRGERCINDMSCETIEGLLWCSGEPPPSCG